VDRFFTCSIHSSPVRGGTDEGTRRDTNIFRAIVMAGDGGPHAVTIMTPNEG
jgi:hypothetical protein